MNRTQAKAWEGNYVKWDWWDSNYDTINSNRGTLHKDYCVGKIWYLMRLTKGGLCMIAREVEDDVIHIVSIAPCVLSEFEYPRNV